MEKEVEVGELKEISAKEIHYLFHKSGNPLEEALMLQNLLEEHTQQELAKTLEISQGQISKRLRLLSLLSPLQKRLLNGELRPSTAYTLSKLPHEIQKDYVNQKRVLLKEVEDRKRSLAITKELETLLETPIETPTQSMNEDMKIPPPGFSTELKRLLGTHGEIVVTLNSNGLVELTVYDAEKKPNGDLDFQTYPLLNVKELKV